MVVNLHGAARLMMVAVVELVDRDQEKGSSDLAERGERERAGIISITLLCPGPGHHCHYHSDDDHLITVPSPC